MTPEEQPPRYKLVTDYPPHILDTRGPHYVFGLFVSGGGVLHEDDRKRAERVVEFLNSTPDEE